MRLIFARWTVDLDDDLFVVLALVDLQQVIVGLHLIAYYIKRILFLF